ncbi:MAG: hypothetical protein COB42_00370, partial [Sulfurimonas sp.]
MNAIIGKVQALAGTFYAKDLDDQVIRLKNGDDIFEGMIVFGDVNNLKSAYIHIVLVETDTLVVVSGTIEQTFDTSLNNSELMDGALEEENISGSEGILAALEDSESEEDTTDIDETAAGEESSGQTVDGKEGQFADRDGFSVNISTNPLDAEVELDSNNNLIQREDIIPIENSLTTDTVTTALSDDTDTTTITLTATASVTEGGVITYSATVDNAPQTTDLVIT